MPHCQKENHDRGSKSKKERQKKKEALLARKQSAKTQEEEELEGVNLTKNNLAFAEGYGEYEIGCDEEKEYKARFNMKKRSKKHLRNDIKRQQDRKEREEEERLQKEQEEQYRLEQEKLEQEAAGEMNEEEEEPLTEEYLIYICQCCHKKFNTVNQFINHTNSRRHKDNAKLFEEAGVIVTDVQFRKDFDDDNFSYQEEEAKQDFESDDQSQKYGINGSDRDDDDDSDSDEEDDEPRKVGSLFGALAAFSDSSSSSDSSDDEVQEIRVEEESRVVAELESLVEDNVAIDYDDDLDLLEEIIYQNRLQERLYPDNDTNEDSDAEIVPVAFEDEQYNPENFNTDENRLAAVRYRLQKRLAAKGVQPNDINPGCRSSDAVLVGKTLLQQVMEANIETLEAKLAAYNRHKAEYQLLGRDFKFSKGNSKALPSQYTFRIDPANNSRRRENIHHTGSHYHMQASRSMQFGRTKGLMARHSAQGSRLQASRMAAQEMAQMHGKGMKVGKSSKKSQQKRRGEAGGSKKTGGASLSEK
eukprot:CAMPEP_0194399250 /NCGR_PEP_ID=MMETSP0174-20130528/126553_1 /TAXON_ID=216777 /ORGANISM="Proboscia alata, Strain PI-D3" /LENGTH=528 /DNA_ID=CAMNT_0039195633 /DNA_START=126 /DNA_END=1712 /DNA_ORIENTATION=-